MLSSNFDDLFFFFCVRQSFARTLDATLRKFSQNFNYDHKQQQQLATIRTITTTAAAASSNPFAGRRQMLSYFQEVFQMAQTKSTFCMRISWEIVTISSPSFCEVRYFTQLQFRPVANFTKNNFYPLFFSDVSPQRTFSSSYFPRVCFVLS